MTTITSSPSVQAASRKPASNRVLAVLRLHFVNIPTIFLWPLAILVTIWLVNLAIWWLVDINVSAPTDLAEARDGFGWTGAATFIFVYMMVVAIQAMSLTFPFALGYGVTRRDFYLGSVVAFVLMSLVWTVVLTAFAVLEENSGGWGLGGRMFTGYLFGAGEWYQRSFVYLVGMLFFFFVGSAIATVWLRWKASGVTVFFIILTVLLVALAALVTVTRTWPAVGDWFATTGYYGVVAWSLIPAVIAAVAGYFILQRSTPKNS